MRDCIVYGYELGETVLNNWDGELTYEGVKKECIRRIEEKDVKNLMEYCGASRKDVLHSIDDGINRAIVDKTL